ncbi:MAG: DUF2164 domain-containing protein [Defluviitaleaceae bacterium]|nr:DUF2164 domain-containing protein [Defluviitaleaceae bacterium]
MRKSHNDNIKLSKEQKESAVYSLKEYVLENFDADIGNLQAEIFLDYITENIGVYYYNKAIADSLSFITEKAEDMYLLMKDEKVINKK